MFRTLITCIYAQLVCKGTFCLFEGFKVAVISRDSNRLEKLKAFVSPSTKDRLITVVGNVGKGCMRLSLLSRLVHWGMNGHEVES